MYMTLLLIEDNLKDVEDLQKVVREFGEYADKDGRKWHFRPEYLRGEKEKSSDGKYQYYDERIFSAIENRVNQKTEDEKIGILLDVLLNASERESGRRLYSYPVTKLAPEIYKKFCAVVPIYAVTSIPHFYVHCKEIMGGVDMSKNFIYKQLWLEDRLKSEIHKLQDFYINWKG